MDVYYVLLNDVLAYKLQQFPKFHVPIFLTKWHMLTMQTQIRLSFHQVFCKTHMKINLGKKIKK